MTLEGIIGIALAAAVVGYIGWKKFNKKKNKDDCC